MKSSSILIVFATACLLNTLQANDLNELRIWHSVDGRTIQARVLEISAEGQSVKMERTDGLNFTLPWNHLSAADKNLLQNAATQEKGQINPVPSPAPPGLAENTELSEGDLPEKHILKDVPMVIQKKNYCVPASATMIAGFHGIKTNQDQVAKLSSKMSASNRGTYPKDMLLAMMKLGFTGRSLHWKNEAEFLQTVIPQIRRSLYETGPIYISFRPGVFGPGGHGCVIVGYNHRQKELFFYNPWGHEFESDYDQVALNSYGLVLIEAPKPAPVASDALVEKIESLVPKFEGDFLMLSKHLKSAGQNHDLIWCSRQDTRHDKRFARDTAREDGRIILELAFERSPAVLIPDSQNGETEAYLFVTRPPEGGARFLVRRIDEQGWAQPKLITLGRLTRNWVTAFAFPGKKEKIWELPMIELHPGSSL